MDGKGVSKYLNLVVLLSSLVVLIAGCAPVTPPADAPRADAPKNPPPGSTWVLADRYTGSYGSASGTRTFRALGEQTWEGQKVLAFSDGSSTTYVNLKRDLIARVRGTTPVESFEPSFVTADWPLFVGKWWPNRYRYRDHERGRTFDNVQYDAKVEAYEDVTTPAGTFKAFKIAFGNPWSQLILWYSPDLGLFIKSKSERMSGHYLGLGTSETELVSYDLKK